MSEVKSTIILLIIGIVSIIGVIFIILTHPLERIEVSDFRYTFRLPEKEWICGDSLEYEGKEYETFQIENQCWLAENLNYETEESKCYNDNEENCETYGRLYAFNEAVDICPEEWRLPSDEDFKILETRLGMSKEQINNFEWRGENEGSKLASINLWKEGELIQNEEVGASGFNALPAGRHYDAGFEGEKETAFFWTSDEELITRNLYYDLTGIRRYAYSENDMLSVRCIRRREEELLGLSPICLEEQEKANEYCSQFSEEECENQSYLGFISDTEFNCHWQEESNCKSISMCE